MGRLTISLLFFTLCLGVLGDDCPPLYWQVNPKFQVKNNQLEEYVKNKITIESINETKTKITHSLNTIVGTQSYDNSQVEVKGNGTSQIIVNNNRINMDFVYNANRTGGLTGNYNGTGSSKLSNIVVNYTKALKTTNGTTSFELVGLGIFVPNAMVVNKFTPTPSQVENQTLYRLASENLYQEINKTQAVALKSFLDVYVKKTSFENPFGGDSYNYNYNSLVVHFNSQMRNVSLVPDKGSIIGYDMKIIGQTTNCTTFVLPADVAASSSYITLQLVKNLVQYVSKQSTAWHNMKLDSTNTKSDVFQFYMADLEDIIPAAVRQFPNLLGKTYALCTINADSFEFSVDAIYKILRARAGWDCSLYLQANDELLLSASPQLRYEVKLSQEGSQMKTILSAIAIEGSTFTPVDKYPIVNPNLATAYLKSLIASMGGQSTVGTGFKQPSRKSPMFDFKSDYIRVWDAAAYPQQE